MPKQIVAIGPNLPVSLGNAIRDALVKNNYHSLVMQLESLIQMKVTGIVLYGSMSKPIDPPQIGESDVDILVLVDEEATGGIFGRIENLEIDLHIQSRDTSINDIAANFIYSQGKVWYDLRPPELSEWLKQINLYMLENKNPWTQADELRHREWAYRLVNKITRIGKIDPTAASLHEARLIANIPTLYKVSQRKYTTSIGNWWQQLLQEDKTYADDISKYLSNRQFPPNGETLKIIIDKLFEHVNPK